MCPCQCVLCEECWLAVGMYLGEGCQFGVQRRYMLALAGTGITHMHWCECACSPVSSVLLWEGQWGWIEMHDCGQAYRIISLHTWLSEDTTGPTQARLSDSSIHCRGFPKCLLCAKFCVRHCQKGRKKEERRPHHIVWKVWCIYLQSKVNTPKQTGAWLRQCYLIMVLRYLSATPSEDVFNYIIYGGKQKGIFSTCWVNFLKCNWCSLCKVNLDFIL